MRGFRSVVFLILEICLLSALAVDVLPQIELRELDIFMQDDEYQQITREKRTDDIQEEAEHSGEGPPLGPDPVLIPDETVEQSVPKQENSTNETPPESPDIIFVVKIEQPSEDVIDSGPENDTEVPTEQNTNINPNISKIDPASASNLDLTTIPTPVDDIGSSKVENASNADSVIDTPNNTELPPPIIESRTGFSQDNASDVQSAQDTTTEDSSLLARGVAATNTSLDSIQEPLPQNIVPDNGNATVNSTVPSIAANATDNISTNTSINTSNTTRIDTSETSKVNSTTTNTTDVFPTKPVVAESDLPQQGGVTGSGVLFTIIILVAIAALASIGYVIYKRKVGGYSPVSVSEDQIKEMVEIENGIGKRIRDDEVRLQDQLTPMPPMVVPKTFGTTPTTERKQHEEEIKSSDDRNTREQSFEFHDETKKDDEQK